MTNPLEEAKQALLAKHLGIQSTRYYAECDKADDLDIAFGLAMEYIKLLEGEVGYLDEALTIWRSDDNQHIHVDF